MIAALVYLVASLAYTVGGRYNGICPSITKRAVSEGVIYSDYPRLDEGSCTLTLTDISPRSWFGVLNNEFYLQKSAGLCKDQELHLAILHPVKDTVYLCGSSLPSVLYTAYSRENVSIEFKLSFPANLDSSNRFELQYRTARVIYDEENSVVSEEILYTDSIVSHSEYPLSNYGQGINSSLILTNARLGSTLQLTFYKLNFASGCLDYLRLSGVRSLGQDNATFCMKETLSMQWTYTVTSDEVRFQFVSTSDDGGLGFRFNYKVIPNTGCEKVDIPHSIFKVDTEDPSLQTYTVTCDGGNFIDSNNTTSHRILCARGNWWLLSTCTDACSYMDDSCFSGCNITSSDVEKLQCTAKEEIKLNQASVKTYVGIGLGISVSCIILVIATAIIVKHRQRLTKRGHMCMAHLIGSHPHISSTESTPPAEETCDSEGHNFTSDGSCYKQGICRNSSMDEDGYHVPNKLLALPSDSLLAPYNSTPLPNRNKLPDQSGRYDLVAPTGSYSTTALPGDCNKSVPFGSKPKPCHKNMELSLTAGIIDMNSSTSTDETKLNNQTYSKLHQSIPRPDSSGYSRPNYVGSNKLKSDESVYHIAATAYGVVNPGPHNPYHLPVPIDCATMKMRSPPPNEPSLITEDSGLVEQTVSTDNNLLGSSTRLNDGEPKDASRQCVGISRKVRLYKPSDKMS